MAMEATKDFVSYWGGKYVDMWKYFFKTEMDPRYKPEPTDSRLLAAVATGFASRTTANLMGNARALAQPKNILFWMGAWYVGMHTTIVFYNWKVGFIAVFKMLPLWNFSCFSWLKPYPTTCGRGVNHS